MTRQSNTPGDDFDGTLAVLFHPVQAFCERMLGDRHEGEDAAQQTFLQAYRAWDRFRGQATRKTWIFRIAANVCARDLESRRRLPSETMELPEETAGEDTNPAARLLSEEQSQAVDKTLQELSPAHRMVLVLFCLEELSHMEIAELLACPEGTVWSRLHHARRAFAERFQQHGIPCRTKEQS